MKVAQMLDGKRASAMSVDPTESVRSVANRLRENDVGVMIVSGDGITLDGIVTERDVAVGFGTYGPQLNDLPASVVMTTAVVTCSPLDDVTEVAKIMAERRLCYLPVKDEGRLVGVISIGDILKQRLEDRRRATRALYGLALAAR